MKLMQGLERQEASCRVGQVFAAHRKPSTTQSGTHPSQDRACQNAGPILVGREDLAHPTY